MSTYKNVSGNWYISVDNGVGTIYVDGNLDVSGNITYVTELAVNDPFIIVAANNTGTVTDMGLLAQKTANTWAGLRWDSTVGAWQISSNVAVDGTAIAAYSNIMTGGGSAFVAGSNTQVQFNDGGNFGATANLTFDKSTNSLTVNGPQVLGNVGSTPLSTANAVTLYNNTVGTGGSGVYAVSSAVNDELVTVTKARLYGIIF